MRDASAKRISSTNKRRSTLESMGLYLAFICTFVTCVSLSASMVARSQVTSQNVVEKKMIFNFRTFLDSCPTGHRIEFVFGTISLYVDPNWLDNSSLLQVMERFDSCPIEPVHGISLHFNRSVLQVANVPANMGDPYLNLVIGRASDLTQQSESSDSSGAKSPPYVEDVTQQSMVVSSSSRRYLLHYAPSGRDSIVVRISCGGEQDRPGGRTCFSVFPYRYREHLSVNYIFRQDRLPIAEAVVSDSTDVTREREGVLAFDIRIRAWIDDLRKKP